MSEIGKQKKKTIQWLSIIFNFVLMLLAYGMLLRKNFNCDTLACMWDPAGQSSGFMEAGRYLFACVWKITYRMGIKMGYTGGMNILITLCLFSLATTIMTLAYFNVRHNKKEPERFNVVDFFAVDSIVLMSFLNLLMLEPLGFSSFALLFGIAAIFSALALFALSNKRYWASAIFVLCMLMSYQAYVGVFISFALLLTFLEFQGKLTKESFWKSVIIVAVTGGLSVADMLSIKLLKKLNLIKLVRRELEVVKAKDVIEQVFRSQINMLKNEYSLSAVRFVPFILVVLALGYTVWFYIHNKKRFGEWVYLFLLIMVSNVCIFATTFGGYLYLAPRVIISYWSFISSLLLLAYSLMADDTKRKILLSITSMVTVLHIVNSNIIIGDLYVSNALDVNYVKCVLEVIQEYEENTGREVNQIAFCTDTDCSTYWTDYVNYYTFNLNERCVVTDWQCMILINQNSDRVYHRIEMPETIYKEYFEGKDWNNFNAEEQMHFEGDTLYLAVY